MSRAIAELVLGIRLAFLGGRSGWIRTAMAATGVAVGTVALLLGASVPVLLDARQSRIEARYDLTGGVTVPAGRTTIVAAVESQYGSSAIRGRLIWPDTPDSPLPPGVPAFPADHGMYVSPALQEALNGPGGQVLRRQMPYQIIGTIAPAGLSGPGEFAYYAGYPRVRLLVGAGAWRVDHFGYPTGDTRGAGTYVVVAAMLATLLLPVAIFIGAALQFGGETRNRRLAAIRLIGADDRAVLRIALAESLVPAWLGLALGTVFYLVVRGGAASLRLFDVSVYPADVHPKPALAVLVVATVLVLAAAMTLLGFRGVVVEPLGVFRRAAVWQGRLWWRLIPLAAAAVLLYPVALRGKEVNENPTGIGVILLIVALIPLLPYLVPLVSRMLPGGTVAWQLASQQLRRNPAASTRAVTGIVVAVAGTIALHAFFNAYAVARSTPDDPADYAFILQDSGQLTVDALRQRSAKFEQVDGVKAGTVAKYPLYQGDYVAVGDCVALRQIATLSRCSDGDIFTFGEVGHSIVLRHQDAPEPMPGSKVVIPATAHPVRLIGSDAQNIETAVLMTPRAAPAMLIHEEPALIETRIFTTMVPETVAGKVRGVAAEIDPLASFTAIAPEADKFASLRTALDIGLTLVLLMMAVGLLLDVAARLYDRRRILGVLSAVGARRSTVVWSVLLQAIVPVLSGVALAVVVGATVGALLMRISDIPVFFDSQVLMVPAATGAALALLTTVTVLLPAARRITRTEELRYE